MLLPRAFSAPDAWVKGCASIYASGKLSGLYRNKEVFRKGPLSVGPGRNALEAASAGHLRRFFLPVLMATLSPYGLIAMEAVFAVFDRDGLVRNGTEMHFDSAIPRVVESHMLKPGKIEVSAQFPVDSGQQIAIEGRGNSE
jgi:hypothetical protein